MLYFINIKYNLEALLLFPQINLPLKPQQILRNSSKGLVDPLY